MSTTVLSKQYLLKQCFANNASLNSAFSTVLLLQNRDVRDVREVRTSFCRQNFLLQKQVFSTTSSETVLLKQVFWNISSEQLFFCIRGRCVMVGCQTQNELEPVRSRLFILFCYIRVLRQSLNADQWERLIYYGLPMLINGGVGLVNA